MGKKYIREKCYNCNHYKGYEPNIVPFNEQNCGCKCHLTKRKAFPLDMQVINTEADTVNTVSANQEVIMNAKRWQEILDCEGLSDVLTENTFNEDYSEEIHLTVKEIRDIANILSNRLEKLVSPIFTEEEHRILKLLLASKIAEIQVHIVYDEQVDQRMGKAKLINILNDIYKKISK